MERVVANVTTETNLRVVGFAANARQHAAHLLTEVAFHFEHEPANLSLVIAGTPTEQLFGVGVHAGGCFARANCADNHDTRVEATLRDRQPRWRWCTAGIGLEMGLAEHQTRSAAPLGWDVRRQWPGPFVRRIPVDDDGREGCDNG